MTDKTLGLTSDELEDLDRRFMESDPNRAAVYDVDADELPAPLALQRALATRAYLTSQAEQVMRDAIAQARAEKMPWHRIGLVLGTTGEAARQRYGKNPPS